MSDFRLYFEDFARPRKAHWHSAWIGLIAIALTVGQATFASSAEENCESILQAAPIQRTVQPIYLIELESAGDIFKSSEDVPHLATGFYTFLIATGGEVLLAGKYDVKRFMESGRGLATHKSLLRMFEEKTLTPVADRIVGAGEFQVAFGSVIDISNKSGNFRTNSKRLQSAIGLLKNRGLPIDASTRVRAIDPAREEDRGHTPVDRNFDEFHLETMATIERSERGPALRDLFDRFHALTCESFPDLSCRDAVAKMLEFRNKGARETQEQRGAASFFYPLLTAYSRDGIEFGLLALLREEVVSEFNRTEPKYSFGVPLQINNVLVGAGDLFSPTLKEKWRTLARSFSDS